MYTKEKIIGRNKNNTKRRNFNTPRFSRKSGTISAGFRPTNVENI